MHVMPNTFNGPLHALLWEQWRLARPVLLLPLLVMVADAGLYFWCRLGYGMRQDDFVDLASWYILGLCAMAMLLLLCHPDRRLELRLLMTPRLLRLPQRRGTVHLVALPLRAFFGTLAVFAALGLHYRIFPSDLNFGFVLLSSGLFLFSYLFLYALTVIATPWGDRVVTTQVTLGLGVVVFLTGSVLGGSDSAMALLGVGLLLGIALAARAIRWLRQRIPARATDTIKSAARGSRVASSRPHFDSPLAAQVWYEWRRRGWLLPALMVMICCGFIGYQQIDLERVSYINLQKYWDRNLLYALALLPAAAVLVAAFVAAREYTLMRSPEGRFLLVRPVSPSLFARARMRMQAASVALAMLGVLLVAFIALSLMLLLDPGLDRMRWWPVQIPVRDWSIAAEDLLKAFALLGVPLAAWCAMFVFNRFTISCIMAGAGSLVVLAQIKWLDFDQLAFYVAVVTVMVAAGWNLSLGLRAGLLRPWPVLLLLTLLPLAHLISSVDMSGTGTLFWTLAAFVALPVLSIAGAPMGFHLQRSSSLWPLPLAERATRWMEWKQALRRVAVVGAVLLGVMSIYHVALARAAQEAIRHAELTLALVPRGPYPVNYAVVEEGLKLGKELAQLLEEMPESCPRDRHGSQEDWCPMQLAWADDKLAEAIQRIEHAKENPHGNAPDILYSLDPGEEDVNVQVAYGSTQWNLYGLKYGLWRKAQAAAVSGDTTLAMRCIESVFTLSAACNAIPYPASPNTYGSLIGSGLSNVLASAQFSPEELKRLQEIAPGKGNMAVAVDWYANDLDIARRFPNLKGTRLQRVYLSPGWKFWYQALGFKALDQIALAKTVSAKSQELAAEYPTKPYPEHFNTGYNPLPEIVWSREQWGYASTKWQTHDPHLVQYLLAMHRYAVEHQVGLPWKPDGLLHEYLPQYDEAFFAGIGYHLREENLAVVTIGGFNSHIRLPPQTGAAQEQAAS